MGRKISVDSNMTNSVIGLEEAFHTVRLECGSMALGRMIGNIDRPTVAITPIAESDEPAKASASRPARTPTSTTIGPRKPNAGAVHIHGWAWKLSSHAPDAFITIECKG